MKVVSQEKNPLGKGKFQNYGRCWPFGRGENRSFTVPGPKPRRGSPQATGTSDPKHLAGKGQNKATGYNLRLCHWNVEGIRPKKHELQNVLKSKNIEVCCIQETHLNSNHRFSIRGYETFRRDRESGPKGGLLILVKKKIHPAVEIYRTEDADTEVHGIKLLLKGNPLSIYNLYSPPPKTPSLRNIKPHGERWIIVGDFNSHSSSWGYPDLDSTGEEVEDWIITNQMVLINHPDDPHTYYSRARRATSCPYLAIAQTMWPGSHDTIWNNNVEEVTTNL